MQWKVILSSILTVSWALLGTSTSGQGNTPRSRGSISGTVTAQDTGLPVPGIGVTIYTSNGRFSTSVDSDEAGKYEASDLHPGTYFVGTSSSAELFRGLFGGVSCPFRCDVTTGAPVTLSPGEQRNNVNMSLSREGRISGKVTDAVTGFPLPGVQIYLFDATKTGIRRATTNTEGDFLLRGLPAGIYFAHTADSGDYVDEIFGGRFCTAAFCCVLTGTPMVVRHGYETDGVDFALHPGGRISGTVVDKTTGDPVPQMNVRVVDARGTQLATALTDQEGRYTAHGLSPGTFFIRTFDSAGFLGELYDGVPCLSGDCELSAGKGVEVALGSETGNIDFAVSRGGTISGIVTAEENGQPLRNASVDASSESGLVFARTRTDGHGRYSLGSLRPGMYFIRSSAVNQGYLNETYDGSLGSLDPTAGVPVTVESGVEEMGIDFTLVRGGTLSGLVLEETTGEPISSAFVRILDREGRVAKSAVTDHDGSYTADGLPPGTYFVHASVGGELVDELFAEVPCPSWPNGCDTTSGTPILLELNADIDGLDFTLKTGRGIAGRAVEQTTGQEIPFLVISVFNGAGSFLKASSTNALGRYRVGGLPEGIYFLSTGAYLGSGDVVDELFGGVSCFFGNCDITAGIPVSLASTMDTEGVDFVLERGGAIGGSLTDEATGQEIRSAQRIEIADEAGIPVASTLSDQNGNYIVAGVPAGTYFLRVPRTSGFLNSMTPSAGFLGELYGGTPCFFECDVATGIPVAIDLDARTSGIDFRLTLGGSFTVSARPKGSAQRLLRFQTDLFDEKGVMVASYHPGFNTSNVAGSSVSDHQISGLPTGIYFVRVTVPGFVSQVFGGPACPFDECDPTAGTPLSVRLGEDVGRIEVSLEQAASLSGTVTEAMTGKPVHGILVRLYDAGGSRIGAVVTDSAGRYRAEGLPAEAYFVRTPNTRGYRGELYHGVPCLLRQCRVTDGTPVEAKAGKEVGGIDFAVELLELPPGAGS